MHFLDNLKKVVGMKGGFVPHGTKKTKKSRRNSKSLKGGKSRKQRKSRK